MLFIDNQFARNKAKYKCLANTAEKIHRKYIKGDEWKRKSAQGQQKAKTEKAWKAHKNKLKHMKGNAFKEGSLWKDGSCVT